MNRLAGALALGCCLLSATLASAADPAPGGMIPVEGGQVYSETCGSGSRALLLIHDGVLHSAGYDAVWPALCKRYHVIRFDRRGYGRSLEAKAPYSSVEDAVAVMRAAGVEHATVIGASEGSAVAVQLAGRFPTFVDRLVLVGPTLGGLAVSDHFLKRNQALIGALRRGGPAEAVKDRYIAAPDHQQARDVAAAILAANPQNITHPDPRKPGPASRTYLSGIKVPTLILVGEYDIPDVQAHAGAAEAIMPDAKRVVMPDAGHMIYLERPDAFVEEVSRFLR
jgi:pimeloyl-ACP methyl ester carboxylesterase